MRTALVMAAVLVAGAVPAIGAGLTPGMWEYQTQVLDAQMPGMPAAVLQMMKKPNTIRNCVTPADAEQGPQKLLQSGRSNCSFTRYNTAGGKIDAVMQCKDGTTVTSQGTMSGSTYSGTSRIEQKGGMKMTVQATGKLLGPCK